MSKGGVLKSGWMMINPTDTRVIDSNALVESKLKELAIKLANETSEDANFTDGFSQGIDAMQVAELVEGAEEGDMQEPVQNSNAVDTTYEQAMAEIEEMKAQAMEEIEQARTEAIEDGRREGYEEGVQKGTKEGYEQGHADGLKSVQEEREKLYHEAAEKIAMIEQEYQNKIIELEPKFIDTLTGIYEHIFQVSLKNSRDLVVHLLGNAMKNIEGNSGFLIHVSKDDYPFVSMQKKEIIAGTNIQIENVDIIEDATLAKSECMIETENGVFDCSLGTQLEALNEELRLLAYTPQTNES